MKHLFIATILFILSGCTYTPVYEIVISERSPNIEQQTDNEFGISISDQYTPSLETFQAYLTTDNEPLPNQKVRWYSDAFNPNTPYVDRITNENGVVYLNFFVDKTDINKTFTFRAQHIGTKKDHTITLEVR